jgi:hypothetical protein
MSLGTGESGDAVAVKEREEMSAVPVWCAHGVPTDIPFFDRPVVQHQLGLKDLTGLGRSVHEPRPGQAAS